METAKAPARYTPVHISLHWLMALMVIGLLGMGLYMKGLDFTPAKFQLYQLHKSLGLTVLALLAARILWRFTTPTPMLPKGMPLWQKGAAHVSHAALYVLLAAMPLSGWLMSDASGYHPNLFGLSIPVLMNPNPELATLFKNAHEVMAYTLMVLLAVHIGAALKHHLVERDDILTRMLPAWLKLPRPRLFGLLLAGLVALPAAAPHAFVWDIDHNTSHITWQLNFNKAPLGGRFSNWHGKIFFNPKVVEASQIEITVRTSSIESGDIGRDRTLQGPDWFNSPLYPDAVFKSASVTQTGPDTYLAEGTLSMAGITRPLTLPFTLTLEGDKAFAKGSVQLKRTDFLLGKGPWEKSQEITDEVLVTFTVNAVKAKK